MTVVRTLIEACPSPHDLNLPPHSFPVHFVLFSSPTVLASLYLPPGLKSVGFVVSLLEGCLLHLPIGISPLSSLGSFSWRRRIHRMCPFDFSHFLFLRVHSRCSFHGLFLAFRTPIRGPPLGTWQRSPKSVVLPGFPTHLPFFTDTPHV